MREPILVVMAAGLGSRYGSLKQTDPIGQNGELIIDYSLFDAKRAGFKKVVFVINKNIESEFKRVIGKRIDAHFEVRFVFQSIEDIPQTIQIPKDRTKPWGTAHAVYTARTEIDASFAVINADDFYGNIAFKKMYDFLINEEMQKYHVMISYLLKNTVTEYGYVSRGVCTVKNEELVDIKERLQIEKIGQDIVYIQDGVKHLLDPETQVSMNMWGFRENILVDIEKQMTHYLQKSIKTNPLKCEYYLPYVVSNIIECNQSKVKVITTKDKWYGVTYSKDKESVINAITKKTESGEYKISLWED